MATTVKESVHLKEKSFSAPSTPGRTFPYDRRQTTVDGDIPMPQEKRVPNYLKPTVSSCHDTSCRYLKSQQQHPEDPVTAATARKRLISTKSMEKPASPSSLPHRTSKEKTPRSSLNPALSLKIAPEKASKVPTSGKTLKKAKSLPRSMPRRREVMNGTTSTTIAIKLEQEDKVLSIDNGVQCHAARHGSRSPKSNGEGKQCAASKESDTGKPGAPRVKVTKKVSSNGVPRKLKFQQGRKLEGEGKEGRGERLKSNQSGERVEMEAEGKTEKENLVLKWQEVKEKDASPAYNDVIEETTTKLAVRRSKVKALVGAFESVISLREPESEPSQPQEEVLVKVGRAGQASQEKEVKVGVEGAERGQAGRAKLEKEVESRAKGAKRGQPDKQQLKKKVKDEEASDKRESKGGQLGQESQAKDEEKDGIEEESKGGHLGPENRTEGEEENGIEKESKDSQSSQELQQKRIEQEERNGKGDMVAKDFIAM